jgi:tetratricopeptide (TPR) repeat protein
MQSAHDPTASERYIALRNALIAVEGDFSAIQSVLSALSDGGKGWVQAAYSELRRALVQGRLKEAETVGNLIGSILQVHDQGDDDELSESRIHRDAMRALCDGIGAVLAQDNLTGISHLERLTEAVYANESLRWAAWYWMAAAAADEGELDRAKQAIDAAMELAGQLDQQARGNSLCRSSEIEFLRGESDEALQHLDEAWSTFEEIHDRRGMAMASLAVARMLTRLGREEEALEAAQRAHTADGDWDDPVVFLSERALLRGEMDEAASVLEPFVGLEPHSPELDRQRRLVAAAREYLVPLAVVADFLRLRDQPPDQATVEALEVLWREQPLFVQARELLAWTLVKVGREQEAAEHFRDLATQKLDPEVQSSVLLGLGCLANRQFRHRQPGARVKAAASAYAQPTVEAREEIAAPEPSVQELVADFEVPGKTDRIGTVEEALEASFQTATATAELDEIPLVEDLSAIQLDAVAPGDELVYEAPEEPSAPAVQTKAVFTGDLQLFAVPDLLDFLNSSRRTGTLVITSEHGIGAVHLKDGLITGAASPGSTTVGEVLLSKGFVTQEQLDSAVESQRAEHPDKLLGAILAEMGAVQREQLELALEQQVRGALLEMLDWKQGRFAFEPDKGIASEAPGEIEIRLDTRGILLDVVRELDELRREEHGA